VGVNVYVYETVVCKPEGERLILVTYASNIKWILKKYCEDVDWIHLSQDIGRWQILVNTTMKLQDSRNTSNSLTS
jgi:hypothetical protein